MELLCPTKDSKVAVQLSCCGTRGVSNYVIFISTTLLLGPSIGLLLGELTQGEVWQRLRLGCATQSAVLVQGYVPLFPVMCRSY